MARSPGTRYPDDVKAKAIELLSSGQSLRSVAKEIGAGNDTILAWARAAGLRSKPAPKVTDAPEGSIEKNKGGGDPHRRHDAGGAPPTLAEMEENKSVTVRAGELELRGSAEDVALVLSLLGFER